MSVNKVILDTEHGQEVLLDVSQDTVSPGTLARGVTATNAAGKKITGIVDLKTKATAISDNVSGKSVVIEKSGDDSLIGLTLYGKTEQFTTTGAQLANILDTDAYENNGITWSCKNGVVTAKGTASAISHSQDRIKFDIPVVADTYYVSGSANGVNVHIQVTKADNSQRWYNDNSFVLDGTEKQVRIYCQVLEGKTVDTTIYPMLNKGETALPYEPYTGGIPSPNPQYPQELVSVGDDGDVEVGVYGKNLFDAESDCDVRDSNKKTIDGNKIIMRTAVKGVEKSTYTYDRWQIDTSLYAHKSITLSVGKMTSIGTAKGCVRLNTYDSEGNRLTIRDLNEGNTSLTVNLTKEDAQIGLVLYSNFGAECEVDDGTIFEDVMLVIGDKALPYEPYKAKQTLSIPTPNGLPAIKVTDPSLATYTDENGNMWCADTIDFERGVYVKRIGEVKSNEWDIANSETGKTGHRFRAIVPMLVVRHIPCVCTHYTQLEVASFSNEGDYIATDETTSGRIQIRTLSRDFSTIEEFKAFVEEEGMKVYYILATPIEIPLTQEEIAEFSVLHSNYPFTTILNNYNALMDVKYSLHTQTYIDEADNKVRDLVEQNKSLINDLKRVKANAIVQKVEGESVVVSDSSDDALRGLRVFGKTEQFTTTGANLFDIRSFSGFSNGVYQTSKGVSATILDDGGVLLTGTPNVTSGTLITIMVDNIIDTLVDGNSYTCNISTLVEYADGGQKYLRTIDSLDKSAVVSVRPYIQRGVDDYANGEIIYPMFNVGTTVLPYEPYTGGIPSPNPQYPQRLKTIGKSKNLLPNNGVDGTINGITFKVNNDGSVTMNGTSTAEANFTIWGKGWTYTDDVIEFDASARYIISRGTDNAIVYCRDAINDINYGMQLNNSLEVSNMSCLTYVYIQVPSGRTCNNETIYPMIRYADIEDDTYEPYGKDDIEVGVYGGNLLDMSNVTEHSKTAKAFNVSLPSGIYTFVCATSEQKRVRIFYEDDTYTDALPWGTAMVCSFTAEKAITRVQVNANTEIDLSKWYCQLECGSFASEYEPYHKQSLTALTPNGLPGIKVTDASLATYTDADGQMWCADEVDFERGVYVQKIYEHEFSGTESFELHQSDRLYHYIQNDFVPIYGLCTIGICEADKTQFGGTGFYFVKTNTYSTVDELKAYLKEKYENGNPVKILGILKTPIETPLSEEELTAYRALHSNYPVTTVLNDSDAHMEVKYNADTKNYIDNKFAELQTALIALGGI